MKKIATMAAAMAMSAMMAMSAFASNYSGTYFYFDAGQAQKAPAHAQTTVTGIETADGDEAGTTDIIVYVQEIEHNGVVGEIQSITVDGQTVYSDGSSIAFYGVDNDLINSKGLINVSVTITNDGHPVDLSDIYLDVEQ